VSGRATRMQATESVTAPGNRAAQPALYCSVDVCPAPHMANRRAGIWILGWIADIRWVIVGFGDSHAEGMRTEMRIEMSEELEIGCVGMDD
jgi:hypothetical protein